MRKIGFIIVMLILVSSVLSADQEIRFKEYWNELDESQKAAFILGVSVGNAMMIDCLDNTDERTMRALSNLAINIGIDDFMKAMDTILKVHFFNDEPIEKIVAAAVLEHYEGAEFPKYLDPNPTR